VWTKLALLALGVGLFFAMLPGRSRRFRPTPASPPTVLPKKPRAPDDAWTAYGEGTSWEMSPTTVISSGLPTAPTVLRCTITKKTADAITEKQETIMTIFGYEHRDTEEVKIPRKTSYSTWEDVKVPAGTFGCYCVAGETSSGHKVEIWHSRENPGWPPLLEKRTTLMGRTTTIQLTKVDFARGITVKTGVYDCTHLVLEVKDGGGMLLQTNEYWVAPDLPPGCYVKTAVTSDEGSFTEELSALTRK
jgi:hypothetical protein